MAMMTYIEAIRLGMMEEMERDPSVFILGEDIADMGGAFRATEGFLEKFGPERVLDTPIAESGFVGAAIGASLMGMRPIVEMQFIDFISCAFDQLTNVAAKNRWRWGAGTPITIRGPCGGGVHGGPFHSQNPEMYFVHTPGLKVVEPSNPYDAKGLIKAAIRDDDPVIYLEHKFLYRRIKAEVPEDDYIVPIGKGNITRDGKDLTIFTYGAMVHTSLDVANELDKEGVSARIVDLRSLLPLDKELIIESVIKTNKVMVVHEDTLTGGIAGEISALINEEAFDFLDGPILRVTAPDTPVPYAPVFEERFIPGKDRILEKARWLLAY